MAAGTESPRKTSRRPTEGHVHGVHKRVTSPFCLPGRVRDHGRSFGVWWVHVMCARVVRTAFDGDPPKTGV